MFVGGRKSGFTRRGRWRRRGGRMSMRGRRIGGSSGRRRVDGAMMWANLHLLCWLSLLPFVTGWMGENHFTRLPSAVYGGVLFLAAVAYNVLQRLIVARGGADGRVVASLAGDWKGKL